MIVYFWEVCLDAEQMSFMRVLWKFQSPRNQLLELRASYNYLTPPPPQSSSIIFIGIENSLKKLIVNWILLPEGKIYFIAICETRKEEGILFTEILFYDFFSEDVRDLGFTVVIDMRGNSSWTTVKPILKVLQDYFSNSIHTAHIIKPDNFWQKQRTNLGSQKYKFEVSGPFIFMKTAISTFLISEAVAITATQYWCRC